VETTIVFLKMLYTDSHDNAYYFLKS